MIVLLRAEGVSIGHFDNMRLDEAVERFTKMAESVGIESSSIKVGEGRLPGTAYVRIPYDPEKNRQLLEHFAHVGDVHADYPMDYTFRAETGTDIPQYVKEGEYRD